MLIFVIMIRKRFLIAINNMGYEYNKIVKWGISPIDEYYCYKYDSGLTFKFEYIFIDNNYIIVSEDIEYSVSEFLYLLAIRLRKEKINRIVSMI